MDYVQAQARGAALIAELGRFGDELVALEGFAPIGTRRNASNAAAFVLELVRKARQLELAQLVREGDCVILKHKGHGTFLGFIAHEPGKALVDREGYGRGWYDVEDVEAYDVDELARWVAICENSLAGYDARRVHVRPEHRARVAGYRAQLERLQAAA